MPFEAARFDFIVCTAAFKNFSEPIEAMNEMYRVLKPGGTALIVDLRGDVSPQTMDRHVAEELHQTGINAFFTKQTFRHMLIKRAYTKAQFTDFAARSTFGKARIEEETIGLNVWLDKPKS